MALRRNIVGVSPNHKRYEIHYVYGDRRGGRPPAGNGGPRCSGRGHTGGLAKPWPFGSSGTSQCKAKVINKHRMSTYRIETNAGQGMAFRRNLRMFRPPALVSIKTREIEWPGTSSPAPFPRSSLSQVPPCCALSSICRMPSCQQNAPRVYVCRPDKHQMQESHAHVLVGYKMKRPWREKGVSPESQWALRPTTNASSRSKQAHSTGAHQLRPVHRSPAAMTGD